MRLLLLLGVTVIAALANATGVRGQLASSSASPAAALPEAIYWKQDLFLIPYEWSSAADPIAAQTVWLLVSKDRGATWNKISEARPQVKAFNYRAEGEGEFWFAIRTIDRQNRAWPAGPYQPELRVIVDTTMPRIDELRAQSLPEGNIQISWRCSDANLDAGSFTIEAQLGAAGSWQALPLAELVAALPGQNFVTAIDGTCSGHVQWQPPQGSRPVALRATVRDRAGNSATYQTSVTQAVALAAPLSQPFYVPSGAGPTATSPAIGSAAASGSTVGDGWMSNSAALAPIATTSPSQPWAPDAVSRAPFRLSSTGVSAAGDSVTAYGDPLVLTEPPPDGDAGYSGTDAGQRQERFAGPVVGPASSQRHEKTKSSSPATVFRQASIKRLPPTSSQRAAAGSGAEAITPVDRLPSQPRPHEIKQVGSRTFALEYDLEDSGRWGIAKVELWGSRDGGQTWRLYTRDEDHRSPVVTTVDEEGLYGFQIVVENTGGAAALAPTAGDEPELWVSVDLQRPIIELSAIERGEGNLADHLILRWHVADDNLEPRPISLFYSSRPTGPWSAIATHLHDTGEYAWRVERHVPARFYLRAEARDTAGNLSAFQTREPVEFSPLSAGGSLRAVEPIGSTAAEPRGAYK